MLLRGRVVEGPAAARITVDGQPYLNFFGSGYLALATLKELRASLSPLIDGALTFARQVSPAIGAIEPVFADVERAAATAFATQSSVYFASGYLTGFVGVRSFQDQFDVILLDEQAHYSLDDAARQTGKQIRRFGHCDPQAVRENLRLLAAGERPLLLTDGVFATTGHVAPLRAYMDELSRYDGAMFVDEAHAFGVVGENGRGAIEHCGVSGRVLGGATLSKAYCAQGAVVACDAETGSRLRGLPPIRGSNSGSPLSAAISTAALNYAARHPEIRIRLSTLANRLRGNLRKLGFDIADSPAPIVSFTAGSRSDMQKLVMRAFEKGVHLYHSDYLGAGDDGCIRCAVFRDHSEADLDELTWVLSALL